MRLPLSRRAPVRAVLLLLFAWAWSAPGQEGTYRMEFLSTNGSAGTDTSGPSHSQSKTAGTTTVSSRISSQQVVQIGGFSAVGGRQIASLTGGMAISLSATGSWQAPSGVDPKVVEEFEATLTVTLSDLSANPICTGSQPMKVKESQTGSFSVAVGGCKPTQIALSGAFAGAYAEFGVVAEIRTPSGVAVTDNYIMSYHVWANWDTLELANVAPASSELLAAGSNRSFTASVTAGLGTRKDAEIRLLLGDADFNPLAASTLVPRARIEAGHVCCGKTMSLGPVNIPASTPYVYLVAVMTAPKSDEVLATVATVYRVSESALSGLVKRSSGARDYWLPGVPVELVEVAANGAEKPIASTVSKLSGSVQFPRAVYEFKKSDLPSGFDPSGKKYRLKLKFQDGESSAFLLFPNDAGTGAEVAVTRSFDIAPGFNQKHFEVNLATGLDAAASAESAEADAEGYWHLWRQAYVMTPAFFPRGVGLSLGPVRVIPLIGMDDRRPEYCYDACPSPQITWRWSASESPFNLWVLWGEHLLHELWGGKIVAPRFDADPLLRLKLGEFNFGYFWAGQSALFMEPSRATHAAGEPTVGDFEQNAQTMTTILWDLADRPIDAEYPHKVGGRTIAAVDAIDTLSLQDITTAIAVAPHPTNAGELLKRLSELHPDLLLVLRDELSFVQHVIELHRTSPPTNVGRPRPLAETDPDPDPFAPIAGSYIAVSLVGPTGAAVASSRLNVEFVYGPGYETLNRVEPRLVQAGNVYFRVPDQRYPVQAFLSIPGSSESPLMIDNAAYWAAVPTTSDHFLAHTFLVPSDVPQVDTAYPSYAAAGTRIQILGRSFGSDPTANAVLFGTLRARVVSGDAASLTVEVPALPGGSYPVTVSRAGQTSNIVDFDVLAPGFSASPASVDFGAVAQGTTAKKNVTVKNGGLAPLVISAASTTGDFSVLPGPRAGAPITLDPGTETSFQVSFTPVSGAARSGTLVLSTNDQTHRAAAIALSGSGGGAAGADIAVTPGALDFGSVAVGQSRNATLTVRNRGGAALNVTSVAFGAAPFTLVSPALPLAIAPGAEQALTLKFAPVATGVVARSLALASNDADEPSLVVALSGTGTATGTTPSACSYGVAPVTLLLGPGAGSGTISVTAAPGCAWTASSSAGFVTLGTASGTGNGSVSYQATANDTVRDRTGSLRVAGLSVDVAQESDGSASTAVPIVLSTAGLNGSFFTSELTLTNRGHTNAIAELTYTAAFGGGSGTASDVVPAGAQLVFPDALDYLRSVGVPIPATGNRGGTLRVKFTGLSTPTAASATVRTASVVPEGRAGLAYGAVARGAALTGTAYLCGLRQNAGDRANVAVINAGRSGDGDVVLRLTVFSGDPASPTQKVLPDVGLSPGGFAQFSGILGTDGLSLTNGWVKVERVGGTAPYFAYAVINDQANSDGSFVPPVTAGSLAGKTGITLPVIVEVSTFSSELVVTNFGSARKAFQVTFVADNVQAAGNAASVSFDLAPGEQRILQDFVQYLRDQHAAGVGAKGPTFAGAAFLTVASGDVSGLFIGARTSAPGGGGRYGLFYTGVPFGSAATTSPVYLYALQQNPDNRANVAFVNTGETDGSGVTLNVEILDGATGSTVRIFEVTLGPKRWTQVSGILTQYAPGVANAYVKVTRTAGNNPFLAYAVVNDGGAPGLRSGDGAFLPMEVEE